MAKLSFKNEKEGKIKTFPNKQKLREFISVNMLLILPYKNKVLQIQKNDTRFKPYTFNLKSYENVKILSEG